MTHARFHGVTALAMTTTLPAAGIWSVWSGTADQAAGVGRRSPRVQVLVATHQAAI
jgi:hypothetical protein